MKKANHLSRCVKGTLRNMENVVGNFVNVTFMCQHGNEAGPY